MDSIEITVPVKQYTARYLKNRYGDPLELTRRDKLGTVLYMMLERDSHELDWSYREYPCSVQIKLTTSMYHRKGTNLTKTNIINFNNIIEEELKDTFRVFVLSRLQSEPIRKKKHAIEEFMKIMRFAPDDFPYETAKKDLDRNLEDVKRWFSVH